MSPKAFADFCHQATDKSKNQDALISLQNNNNNNNNNNTHFTDLCPGLPG